MCLVWRLQSLTTDFKKMMDLQLYKHVYVINRVSFPDQIAFLCDLEFAPIKQTKGTRFMDIWIHVHIKYCSLYCIVCSTYKGTSQINWLTKLPFLCFFMYPKLCFTGFVLFIFLKDEAVCIWSEIQENILKLKMYILKYYLYYIYIWWNHSHHQCWKWLCCLISLWKPWYIFSGLFDKWKVQNNNIYLKFMECSISFLLN